LTFPVGFDFDPGCLVVEVIVELVVVAFVVPEAGFDERGDVFGGLGDVG